MCDKLQQLKNGISNDFLSSFHCFGVSKTQLFYTIIIFSYLKNKILVVVLGKNSRLLLCGKVSITNVLRYMIYSVSNKKNTINLVWYPPNEKIFIVF